jgi:protease-4
MKQVLQLTLAFLLAFFVVIAIVAVLGIGFFASLASGSKPSVPRGCILTVDLSAPVTERGGAPSPFALLEGDANYPVPAHEIASALRHAATDERVKGVLLHGGVSGSMSALTAAREALADVRAAKKPVLAYYGSGDEKTVWFASAADESWMEPLGIVVFDGFSIEVPYFGDTLKKYGVEVQVTRVGKYKSAVEPFMLGHMSPENREQLEGILRDTQGTLYTQLAAARGLEVAKLEEIARESGWLSSERAVKAGLVTKAAPFGEMMARLRTITGVESDDEVPQVALSDYAQAVWKNGGGGDGIQVIVAQGEIVDGEHGSGIGGDDLSRSLRAARLDEKVKAVVLRVDSPGGSATASDTIRHEVLALREAGKPIVVSMGSLAASGGYWISANADAIVAQPETITGSIGVFGMLPNLEQLAERHGFRTEVVRTSPLSGFQSLWHRKDEDQIERIQSLVDRIYEEFLDLVSEGRHLPRERVHEIAQGRVWSGLEGKELGLVDEIGGLDRAIAIARERRSSTRRHRCASIGPSRI